MRLSPLRRSRTLTVPPARSMLTTSVLVCTSILNRSRNISGDETNNVRSSAMTSPT
jgi:hypothetical protein